MPLADSIALFRRLGVNVQAMTYRDFKVSYFGLAKRYHPDANPKSAELFANINAAKTDIVKNLFGEQSSD